MLDPCLYFVFPGKLTTNTGGYHYDRQLITELERSGIAITSIALSEKFPFPDESALTQADQALASIPDDSIVILDGLAFGAMKSIAEAQKNRLCLIALCHHPLAMETGLDRNQRKLLLDSEAHALKCARRIIVTSQNTRKILVEDYSIAASKITVALPGTGEYVFAECNGAPPQLLTCASLTKRKGHDVLIESLKCLKHQHWEARFVGDESLDPAWASALKERIKSSGLNDRIELVGTVKNLTIEYQKADVFVLPSRFEGYGMVLSEALAHGLPIISTDAGAIPEVVPKSAGILVSPGDHLALAAAMQKIIVDRDLRKKMQLNAQTIAHDLPSWKNCAEFVIKGLEEISKP